MPSRTRRLASASLALLLGPAVLTACRATTLVGKRVDRGDGPMQRELDGFPFVLTQPAFAITRDEKGVDALAVRWVPDMSRVYTLRLDPAFIADSKFLLELNKNGSLKGVTTSSVENATPTLKVIGQLAASVIGLGSVLGTPSLQPDAQKDVMEAFTQGESRIKTLLSTDADLEKELDPFLKRLLALFAKAPPYEETLVWDDAWLPSVGRAPVDYGACKHPRDENQQASVPWHEDHWRTPENDEPAALQRLIGKLLEPVQSKDRSLVPWSPEERLWLSTARKLIGCESEVVARLLAAIASVEHFDGTEKGRRAPDHDARRGKACETVIELARALGLATASCTPTDLDNLRKSARSLSASLEAERKTLKVLLSLEDDLRRLVIEKIEKEIESLRRSDAAARADTPSSRIAELEREWAVAIGAFEEWVQEQKLLALLQLDARPTTLPEHTQAEAVRDYERARLQLAAVRRAMTEKRSRFKNPIPDALPNPKDAEVKELTVANLAPFVVPPTLEKARELLETPDSPVLLEAISRAAKERRFVLVREKRLGPPAQVNP
jgi:hypothetical protein